VTRCDNTVPGWRWILWQPCRFERGHWHACGHRPRLPVAVWHFVRDVHRMKQWR